MALVDFKLNGDDGIKASNMLIEADEQLKVIITGFPSHEIAVKAMKAGAFDYLSRRSSDDKIIQSIQRALRERKKELLQKEESPIKDPVAKIILICNHAVTIKKMEKYEKGSEEFKLEGPFRSVSHLKNSKLGQDVDIAMICESCINKSHEKLVMFFSELSQSHPKAHPVLITQSLSNEEKIQFLKLGVKGFMHPDLDPETMNNALAQIKKGEIWASRLVTSLSLRSLIEEHSLNLHQTKKTNAYGLTKREIEILENLVKGLKNREIADKLIISEMTVKTHINRIFKKLEVTNRSKAILLALENSLVYRILQL